MSLTDKLSIGLTEEVTILNKTNDEKYQELLLTLELSHPIIEAVSGSVYVQSAPISNWDRTWKREAAWQKKMTIGLNLGLSIF